MTTPDQRIAVIIPCRDEAATIAKVVTDFRKVLPESDIYVCDNNSTDGSADIARAAGAIVRQEKLPGKGHVVRRMFSDVEADISLLVDVDDTCSHLGAREMMERLEEDCLVMVVGTGANLDITFCGHWVFPVSTYWLYY